MTSRPKKGGRIPPDGRPSQAKGVGKNAKRHDLERPKTPGLHDSDLQVGDVGMLERGQQAIPIGKRNQPSAQSRRPNARTAPQGPGGAQEDAPDPIDFLGSRLGNTLTGRTGDIQRESVDIRPWIPLLQMIASRPGSSGILGQALITQMGNLGRTVRGMDTPLIDLQDADARLEDFVTGS